MDRIPLSAGKETPSYVEKTLAAFGNNPHGEPNFRLIWSERKQIYFAGEIAPEYIYLDPPCWVLEIWTAPEVDAGSQANYTEAIEFIMGPYPRKGTYNLAMNFAPDWYPTEEIVQVLAVGLTMSKGLDIAQRTNAIREALAEKAKLKQKEVADAIVELQDSASLGRIQQAASGPKNTFRTPEDFERDQEKVARLTPNYDLPKTGGKIVR